MKTSELTDYANANCTPEEPVLVFVNGVAVPVAFVDVGADGELIIELEG